VAARGWVIRSMARSTGPRTARTPTAQTAAERNSSKILTVGAITSIRSSGMVTAATNTANTAPPTGRARSALTRSDVI
jgi:hypothetical protein